MYDRLMNFLIKHQILCKYQFGFRSGYSADMALTVLLDIVANGRENKQHVLGVFLDLSKTLDTYSLTKTEILLHTWN